jgi:hypothetical protein
VRKFTDDNSAWADFLISKAALILASIILFAALFHLIAGFEELEKQEQLDFLARDFKTAVDKAGAGNFQGASQGASYCFNEKEVFRALQFDDVKICVSGEYVCLKAESNGRNFSAVRPFAFRILPFEDSLLKEKLRTRFGTDGSEEAPIKANYSEIEAFLQVLGTEEAVLDPEEKISLKKEFVYVKDEKGVSTFGCILIYQ